MLLYNRFEKNLGLSDRKTIQSKYLQFGTRDLPKVSKYFINSWIFLAKFLAKPSHYLNESCVHPTGLQHQNSHFLMLQKPIIWTIKYLFFVRDVGGLIVVLSVLTRPMQSNQNKNTGTGNLIN